MRLAGILLVVAATACGGDDGSSPDAHTTTDAARAADATATTDAAATVDAISVEGDAALPAVPAPIAYWRMDTADVTADVLADHIGTVDGALNGATVVSDGRVAQAIALDGITDFIDFGDSLDGVFVTADGAFSVSLWVRPAATGQPGVLIGKTSDTACAPDEDGRQWLLALSAAGAPVFSYQTLAAGSAKLVTGSGALATPGTWYHVVVVYDGSINTGAADRVAIYLDGALDASPSLTETGAFPIDIADGPARLCAGVRLDSAGNACVESGAGYLAGALDEVAVWDHTLTADDVAAIYLRGQAGAAIAP